MKKILIIIILFLIPLVLSSFTIGETTLRTIGQNYTLYLNNTITLDKIIITSDKLELYNLSGGGNFTNTNSTYQSNISFYGIKSPSNDLAWDNGTIRYDLNNVNITIPALRYFEIRDNGTLGEGPTGGGGGGLINNTEEIICNILYSFLIEVYTSENTTYDTDLIINLTDQVNARLGSDYMVDTIIGYIEQYPEKCSKYQELPAGIYTAILEVLMLKKTTAKELWEEYKNEVIFFSIISIGIFGFGYYKRKKKKNAK
ncbi:MAG: hypothetical protein KKB31_00505 [Nanoarchaeota archaeon]|nr:hypothetical protein [Nanoarchaeota archaeon]